MNDFLKSIGGGFAGLLRSGGRDGRLRFWPYAVFVRIWPLSSRTR